MKCSREWPPPAASAGMPTGSAYSRSIRSLARRSIRSDDTSADLSVTSPSARALPYLYDPRMTGLAGDAAVQVAGLRMRFGGTEALHGVDFDVRYGEVFCLLGPNGAGKTTTLEILEGFRTPSAGR